MCAAIIAMHKAYAVDIDIDEDIIKAFPVKPEHTDTTSTPDLIPDVWEQAEYQVECERITKSKYPMIEQYAPQAIKEVCQRPSIMTCPECQAAERILWCAKQFGKSLDGLKKNPELYYYCGECFSPRLELVVKIIDAFARKANLDHDQAFALFKEFNRAMVQAQKDGHRERAKYEYDLTHPN
jgi:hypothetical protein